MGGHVNPDLVDITGEEASTFSGVVKLVKCKPVSADDHFGYHLGKTCQRIEPPKRKTGLRELGSSSSK